MSILEDVSCMSCVAQPQDLHLPEQLCNMVCTKVPVYKPSMCVLFCRLSFIRIIPTIMLAELAYLKYN